MLCWEHLLLMIYVFDYLVKLPLSFDIWWGILIMRYLCRWCSHFSVEGLFWKVASFNLLNHDEGGGGGYKTTEAAGRQFTHFLFHDGEIMVLQQRGFARIIIFVGCLNQSWFSLMQQPSFLVAAAKSRRFLFSEGLAIMSVAYMQCCLFTFWVAYNWPNHLLWKWYHNDFKMT